MNATASRLAAIFAIAAFAIPLAACGEETLVQGDLEDVLEESAPPGIEVSDASCPDDVSSDPGTEFDCTADINGEEEEVPGEVSDEEIGDDQGVIFDFSELAAAGGATGAE